MCGAEEPGPARAAARVRGAGGRSPLPSPTPGRSPRPPVRGEGCAGGGERADRSCFGRAQSKAKDDGAAGLSGDMDGASAEELHSKIALLEKEKGQEDEYRN